MKARQQSLHDERWQSRARNEGDTKKLYDVRVAESAHQLTFPYELGRGFSFTQNGVNRYDHLLHFTVGSTANFSASELDVGENERPQPGMIAKEVFSHDSARSPSKPRPWSSAASSRGKFKMLRVPLGVTLARLTRVY